jgi:DNA replication and repair protein RecF
MPLERLRIRAVRCLSAVDLSLDPKRNYLFGPNGAGKTTLLECVHLLGRGRSFRTRQTGKLVQTGASELTVSGNVLNRGLRHTVGLRFRKGNLEVRVDGSDAGSIVDLARLLPVHVIDPQVHELIEAGPSERRRYLDAGVFHVEPSYLGSWRDYRRVLAQRNSALKRHAGPPELGVWTEALAEAGRAIDAARGRYVESLARRVQDIGHRLVGREIHVEYRSGWRRGLELVEAIRESAGRDAATGFTQVGPHRADINVRMAETGVRDAASRGQQKLVAATLVLAQVEMFADLMGHGGTVLVDDPAAELDAGAVARLLGELHALNAQLILTGLAEAALAPSREFPVFHVEQGQVKAVL